MNLSMVLVADDDNPDVGDLKLTDGQVTLTASLTESVAQHLYVRLRFFFGEWFLNRKEGVPYLTVILVKNPNMSTVRSLFRRIILETPGVTKVNDLTIELDTETRALTVTGFEAILQDGSVLTSADFGEFLLGSA